jgi:hypothetical protein
MKIGDVVQIRDAGVDSHGRPRDALSGLVGTVLRIVPLTPSLTENVDILVDFGRVGTRWRDIQELVVK